MQLLSTLANGLAFDHPINYCLLGARLSKLSSRSKIQPFAPTFLNSLCDPVVLSMSKVFQILLVLKLLQKCNENFLPFFANIHNRKNLFLVENIRGKVYL